ncbi:hypothetical protein [Labrys sp. ZIDIC5]|uniref:hypothetical protein n=1 Tax=Labrys sedimenti TaxID=3106036 RepID=UPI002ACA103C|nr:hypothetical protein [Labrys sp. ZIDIC5]MDZ5453905.1 hypothetical protein [Labrys sp. ZIDIC5]
MTQITQIMSLLSGNFPEILKWPLLIVGVLTLVAVATHKIFKCLYAPATRKGLRAVGRALNALFIALVESVIPERPLPLPRWFDRTIRDIADLSIVLCASLTAISMGVMTLQIFIGLAVHPEQPFLGRIAAMGFAAFFLWLTLFVAKMAVDHGRSLWHRGFGPRL